MDHDTLIGKTLKDLIENTPDYAINFYSLTYEGKVYPHIKDVLSNSELLNAEITKIDVLTSDHTYWVALKKIRNVPFVVDMLKERLEFCQNQIVNYSELIFYDRKWAEKDKHSSFYKVKLEENRKKVDELTDQCEQLIKAIDILKLNN